MAPKKGKGDVYIRFVGGGYPLITFTPPNDGGCHLERCLLRNKVGLLHLGYQDNVEGVRDFAHLLEIYIQEGRQLSNFQKGLNRGSFFDEGVKEMACLFVSCKGTPLMRGGSGSGQGAVTADLLDKDSLLPAAEIKSALFRPYSTITGRLTYQLQLVFSPPEAARHAHGLPLILCIGLHPETSAPHSFLMFLGVLQHDLTRMHSALRWKWGFAITESKQEWSRPGGVGPPPPCVWLEEELGKVGMKKIAAC